MRNATRSSHAPILTHFQASILSAHAFLLIALILMSSVASAGQPSFTQTVRGRVVDLDTQASLIGVNVIVVGSQPLLGASTNENGRFEIAGVPVGRRTLQVSYIGYEPLTLSDVLITAGKELVFEIELEESVIETEEVVVVAEERAGIAVNEMASVSARSFSVEQTERYAASFSDPARMAQTFAGVSGGGDDLLNDIVVRGNSPRGILWRLEGIEIPNPNHFGEEGSSGGGISMLSSSTMGRSDFFTGAFPAEYGNAASGVFDLFLRNGNLSKKEYILQVGVLGVEASVEGPFSASYDGSYLVNYRYSTLGILNNFGVLPEESIQYQDLSFKFTFPTKSAGHFTVFGLGGDASDVYQKAIRDSSAWRGPDDGLDSRFLPKMGVIGVSHLWLLGPKTYLKTIAAAAGERRLDRELRLVPENDYEGQPLFDQDTRNWAYRASVQLNHKFSAKQTLHLGMTASHLAYDLLTRERPTLRDEWVVFLDQAGSTRMLEGHVQLKFRPSSWWTLTPGLHYTYFGLNGNRIVEPRLGMNWEIGPRQSISVGVGLHSRAEPIGVYQVERARVDGSMYRPHAELDLMKAWHYVVGYDRYFTDKLRFKIEAYFQDAFDVAVSADAGNPGFSSINAESVWPIVFTDEVLVNAGSARNYGLEMTLEKYLSKGYYFLLTGSIYDALYTPLDGKEYPSRYAGNYVTNLVAGNEFELKRKSLLGFNARFILAGGNRYTPLDLVRSRAEDRLVFDAARTFAGQIDAYYRLDLGVSYTINRAALTHAIRLDVQNVTGRENVQGYVYGQNFIRVPFYHTGTVPVFSYRVSF